MNEIFNFLQRLPETALIVALAAAVVFGSACSSMRTGTSADTLNGNWEGSITIPDGTTMQLFLEFYTNADGDYGAFLKVPEQTENSFQIENITIDKKKISFTVVEVQADYKGIILSKDKIEGEFTQEGNLMPVVFERAQ